MKYFKYELWGKMNSEIESERLFAEQEWEKNIKEYFVQFQMLKDRLPKSFRKLYMINNGFHDLHPKKIEVINTDYGFGKCGNKDSVSIKIVLNDRNIQWELQYKNIKKLQIQYQAVNDINELRKGFNDFGYDEFLAVDDKILSHEILFASGSMILIHFGRISVKKLK